MSSNWPPCASIDTLKARSLFIMKIRQFFFDRNVLEVDTPSMSQACVTDIHLHSFTTRFIGPGFASGVPLYLVTSPEFHMKRLLAAGSGPIFQINKAFRNEEAGRYHNPEFTMLEWYRPDFDHHALMDEIECLLQELLNISDIEKISYQQIFIKTLGICPLKSTLKELKKVARKLDLSSISEQEQNKDTLLQLLFSMKIEPVIGQNKPIFVYHFPASQAALAKLCPQDNQVAARFELYFKGIELANGFYELDDANEQQHRFEQDNRKRKSEGLSEQPIDKNLIAALEHGLPDCAGVAIGIDRLLMIALNKTTIDEVIAFPIERA